MESLKSQLDSVGPEGSGLTPGAARLRQVLGPPRSDVWGQCFRLPRNLGLALCCMSITSFVENPSLADFTREKPSEAVGVLLIGLLRLFSTDRSPQRSGCFCFAEALVKFWLQLMPGR